MSNNNRTHNINFQLNDEENEGLIKLIKLLNERSLFNVSKADACRYAIKIAIKATYIFDTLVSIKEDFIYNHNLRKRTLENEENIIDTFSELTDCIRNAGKE